MKSILITTSESPQEVLPSLIPFYTPNHLDIHVVSPEETTIGIDQIHAIIRDASTTPISAPYTVCVIYPADTITIPAQQALLKLLEEPPQHFQSILITEKPAKLLPTIRSRTEELRRSASSTTTKDSFTWIHSSASIRDVLTWAEQAGKNKADALKLLESYVEEHRWPTTQDELQTTRAVVQSISLLHANANVRLVLEHLGLSILRHYEP